MTSPVALPSASTTPSGVPASGTDRTQLKAAAKQFEAIFVRQMLSAARKTQFGGEDALFSGQGLDTFRQMQDEKFAEIASDTGAFGLGKMIEAHLARMLPPTTPATSGKGGVTDGI
ncbi:MAG TPA: rod-binding protein [Novosphingobium sp.]